jgi:hypothetical protein
MHMHYAPGPKRLELKDPICGYMADDDEMICMVPSLCTCPECLDWIRPDHDSENSGDEKHE